MTLKTAPDRMINSSSRIFIYSNLFQNRCCKTTPVLFVPGYSDVADYAMKCCKWMIFITL